ncbi:MAG: aspartate aminotransferase [Deltaproteobacteria bacterium]|nr:aspartate aminotransferase [Deltaproteobacteria bacterium]
MKVAGRMANIKPSATFAVKEKARALRAGGADVISFAVGEPDFDTPEHVRQAAIEAIQQGFTRYTAVSGIDELREAIAGELRGNYGLVYEPSDIVVSCGAKHSIYNLAQVLFDPGDEVLIPVPFWVSYPEIVRLADAVPVEVATREEDGFKLRPEALEGAITPKTRALILNSPSNPAGSVYTRRELEALAPILLRHKLVVISDDIYYRILFDDHEWTSVAMLGAELRRQTVIVNGVSKTYAMTGWRIGYLAAVGEIAGAVNRLQSQNTSNPNSIAQKAAVAALTGPQECVGRMVAEYDRRRQHMLTRLAAIPDLSITRPSGAFYMFVNASAYLGRSHQRKTMTGSVELASYLLDEAHLATVPGIAFGDDRCLRFSYALPMAQIDRGLDRLAGALARLG